VNEALIDFGAPEDFGAHLFKVEIPLIRQSQVRIIEDFGFQGGEGGLPYEDERVILERSQWNGIAEAARKDFNIRLKAQKLSTGRWRSGVTKVERLLGKELCILAWAAERALPDELPIICARWSALRPEERWWLFSMTAAEAGQAEDKERGWRKALYYALSDGQKPTAKTKKQRPSAETEQLSLPLFGG